MRFTPCALQITRTIFTTARHKCDLILMPVAHVLLPYSRSHSRFSDYDYVQTPSENQKSTQLCMSFVSSYWFWAPVARPSSSHMSISVLFSNQNTTTPISAQRQLTINSPQPTATCKSKQCSQQPAATSKQQATSSQHPPVREKGLAAEGPLRHRAFWSRIFPNHIILEEVPSPGTPMARSHRPSPSTKRACCLFVLAENI